MDRYKVQVDYVYNIEDGSSVTSSVYYFAEADSDQNAILAVQNNISGNTSQRTMLHEGKKYLVLTNTGIAVNAIIE